MLQQPEQWTIPIDGVLRTALAYPGSDAQRKPSPVVFVFHGFTGNAYHAARAYSVHTEWKEATVVYPQGLAVYSPRLLRSGPGWQHRPGEYEDRDLKFVDALLKEVKARYRVDERRVYACGMSNGALFCFLLLTERPHPFAAFAPVAGAGGLFLLKAHTPRPVMMVNGRADRLVSFQSAERTRDLLLRLNDCRGESKEWAKGCVLYPSAKGQNPVVFCTHDGGHTWPPDTTKRIVRFFKEHRLP